MTELHRGTTFVNSCVKMPVDPYSRQPTPSYERPRLSSRLDSNKRVEISRCPTVFGCSRDKLNRSGSARLDGRHSYSLDCLTDDCCTYLDFVKTIPDYEDMQFLSNEQFKQKLDYLKRKQRILLKNLRNCLDQDSPVLPSSTSLLRAKSASIMDNRGKSPCERSVSIPSTSSGTDLSLEGKRCLLEESRCCSPLLCPTGTFSCLVEDQDLLTYNRCKDREKAAKTRLNEEIMSGRKSWLSSDECLDSEDDLIGQKEVGADIETKSLPPSSPKRWQPTLPKPFSFTLSNSTQSTDKLPNSSAEDAEKYMTMVEQQAMEELGAGAGRPSKKKKRRIRPVPLTSKIPLYDKLMAEKEERSRIVREEAALSLLSQVRPFRLECDRRALRALTRSSPELSCGKRSQPAGDDVTTGAGFKAKPVPRNLFSTEVYDRMIEDEYFRSLKKRIRAAELMKSSYLPPSMARRERCKSAVSVRSQNTLKSSSEDRARSSSSATGGGSRDSVALGHCTPLPSERTRTSVMVSTLPPHGNNLAAILRAQASRMKLEREVQEQLEEKRREQMLRLRKALISRKPAWRALRSAARHEHERDLDFRAALRRDEAREQAERHRLQMEMMLDRVTRIPTLFERYSQSFQNSMRLCPELFDIPSTSPKKKKKKKKSKPQSSSSNDSYASIGSSRPNSGSLTSSSTLGSLSRSSGSNNSQKTTTLSRATPKFTVTPPVHTAAEKKKVSINETAELIEDLRRTEFDEGAFSMDSATSKEREEREKHALEDETEKEIFCKKERKRNFGSEKDTCDIENLASEKHSCRREKYSLRTEDHTCGGETHTCGTQKYICSLDKHTGGTRKYISDSEKHTCGTET